MAETDKSPPSAAPADAPAEGDQEAFLSRWSRLKGDARHAPPQRAPETSADPKAPAPELPPLDKLTFESDYGAFFHPKVDEDVRRAALKKLFSDPRFNVMDGLDVYIDDYSKTEPIPPEMLAGLRQAQNILKWAKEDEEERARAEASRVAGAEPAALESPAESSAPGAATPSDAPDAQPVSPAAASKPAEA